MDLTVGEPKKILWKYCLPLFWSIIFQQLYNIADSFVAGIFIGENALAAVGNSYEITLVYLAFAFGCNMGASVISAGFYGKKNYTDLKTAVSTSFIMTAVICALLTVLGFVFVPDILILINTPAEIMEDTLTYIEIYTAGLAFLFLYNITTGIFAAIGDSKTPFIFLSISSIVNIGMNILFVAAFKMGVAGVAWATFICQGISCVLSVIVLFRWLKKLVSDTKVTLFSFTILKKILNIAIPSILQQTFISVGNILIQSVVNSFGTGVIAGYSAAIKYNNFAVTSCYTVGTGISNYTAQNLSVREYDRIKQGFSTGIKFISIIAITFSVLYFTLPKYLMRLFISADGSAEAMQSGIMFMRIVSPFYIIVSVKLIGDGVLRGAERMGAFMVSTFVDLIVRVALAYILSNYFGSNGIWASWPLAWFLGMAVSLVFYTFYKNRKFAKNFNFAKRISN